jgi:phospholipid N-methyltransferase
VDEGVLLEMSLPDYSEWLTDERLQVEEQAWLEAGFHKVYAREVDEALGRSIAPVVLELGCGVGLVPEELIKARHRPVVYYGVDRNFRCACAARWRNPAVTVIDEDIRDILSSADLEEEFAIPQPYLVCSFAVLKHFDIHESISLIQGILTLSPVSVFSIPVTFGLHKNDGLEFNHTWLNFDTVKGLIGKARKSITRMSTLEGDVIESLESEREVIFSCST